MNLMSHDIAEGWQRAIVFNPANYRLAMKNKV